MLVLFSPHSSSQPVELEHCSASLPPKISGIFPHLAHTNQEGEVGIGAVVPWADSLWTNTYGPHLPYGSSDKLRRIDRDWNVIEHPESVGGTPANRMIHVESRQLLLGHHLIDNQGKVRTIDPRKTMPGRITANARHLTDPKNKCLLLHDGKRRLRSGRQYTRSHRDRPRSD